MARRNFSMQAYWEEQVENFTPRLHFDSQKMDWENWRQTAHAKYMELLGSFPDPVPLDAEIESSVEDDGLIRERVVFNSEPFMSVPCQVLRPKTMPADGSNAAILCSHGHGPFGKDPVAGIRSSDEMRANIEMHNYDYGWQMAKAGYLTISPDLRGFGERRDGRDPFPGRDPVQCQLYTRYDARPLAADTQHLGHEMLRRLPGDPPGGRSQAHRHDGPLAGRHHDYIRRGRGAAHRGRRHHGLRQPVERVRVRARQFLRLADRARYIRLVRHR